MVGVAHARAADLRVFSAGAFRPVLQALVPAFEARNGSKIIITTDTAGGIAARIGRGEPFDLAILTPAAVEGTARDSQVILVTPIASVGVGLAVKAGSPKPDISSSGALKQALLAAPKVAMVDPASGGTSGVYLMSMFDKLGIADQMKPKLVLTQGGLAAERPGRWRGDAGVGPDERAAGGQGRYAGWPAAARRADPDDLCRRDEPEGERDGDHPARNAGRPGRRPISWRPMAWACLNQLHSDP